MRLRVGGPVVKPDETREGLGVPDDTTDRESPRVSHEQGTYSLTLDH